jgi:hypothetical protein
VLIDCSLAHSQESHFRPYVASVAEELTDDIGARLEYFKELGESAGVAPQRHCVPFDWMPSEFTI